MLHTAKAWSEVPEQLEQVPMNERETWPLRDEETVRTDSVHMMRKGIMIVQRRGCRMKRTVGKVEVRQSAYQR